MSIYQAAEHHAEGNRLVGVKDYAAAKEAYTKSIAIEPNTARHCNRALCYLELGEYGLCITDCKACGRLNGTVPDKALYRWASAMEKLGAMKAMCERLDVEPK